MEFVGVQGVEELVGYHESAHLPEVASPGASKHRVFALFEDTPAVLLFWMWQQKERPAGAPAEFERDRARTEFSLQCVGHSPNGLANRLASNVVVDDEAFAAVPELSEVAQVRELWPLLAVHSLRPGYTVVWVEVYDIGFGHRLARPRQPKFPDVLPDWPQQIRRKVERRVVEQGALRENGAALDAVNTTPPFHAHQPAEFIPQVRVARAVFFPVLISLFEVAGVPAVVPAIIGPEIPDHAQFEWAKVVPAGHTGQEPEQAVFAKVAHIACVSVLHLMPLRRAVNQVGLSHR